MNAKDIADIFKRKIPMRVGGIDPLFRFLEEAARLVVGGALPDEGLRAVTLGRLFREAVRLVHAAHQSLWPGMN